MIRLESTATSRDTVELGEVLEFRLVTDQPSLEARFFLHHRPILYPRPLVDWTTEPNLAVFPEAPGRYTLAAEWRSAGVGGWEKFDFTVAAGGPLSPAPTELALDSESRIWVPSEWEARVFKDTEKATVDLLRQVVEPGTVAYDLGANLGIYSCPMARLAGPGGYVYCIEANPICVHFLCANLALQGFDNVEILPVAVLDRSGETRFTINYGNSNLGLSEQSGFYGAKTGHEIQVPCFELDRLIETFGLRPPGVIKLDVEGVEHLAIQGMQETLAAHRPTLVMELHGRSCARATLEILDRFAYRYFDPVSGSELESIDAVAERFGGVVFELLARPPS